MPIYNGTTGNNTLNGGNGADTLNAFAGNDSLNAGAGNDLLYGGDGNDTLNGGTGNDTEYGDAGNDLFVGGTGNDSLFGGTGADTASYAASTAAVAVNLSTGLGSGGYAAGDVLAEIEHLIGSSYNDTLTGDADDNSLNGGAGNDVLAGGGGNDSLIGGTGTDTADYTASGAGVTVNLGAGTAFGGDASGDVLTQIENLLGTTYADILTGDGASNVLTGNAGDDSLFGGAGSDSLYGGDGNDALQGGAGSDRLEGGAGVDSADYSESTAAVNVNLATGTGSGGNAAGDVLVAVENIFGSVYNDQLYGSTGDNFLSGGTGSDYLSADAGIDTLEGGTGADTLYGGSGMDYLDYSASNAAISVNLGTGAASGGHATGDVLAGVDGIFGSVFDDTLIGFDNQGLVGDVYTNVFFGGGGNDYIDVGAGNDIAHGDEGNDSIYAGAGDDLATGGEGNDALYGGEGNDSADGGDGNDLIDGGAGSDSLSGGTGNDSLYGGAGNDSLFGGDGNDLMSGGAGADALTGGAGSDTFIGGAGDTIIGGAGDNDVLDLSASTPYRIIKDPNDPTSGTVEFLDIYGNVTGTLSYSGIDSGIACFTPGAMVETNRGLRAIETLTVGDKVLTRDRGFQPVRWIGNTTIAGADLMANAALQPILIRQGALGPNLPTRDMMVSRQHCILSKAPRAELYFGEREVFIRALHMAGQSGILHALVQEVTYIHLMFDHHEVIMADGVWSESFQPAARNIGGLDEAARAEVLAVFADMPEPANPDAYVSARLTLKAHEARLLLGTDLPLRQVA